MIALWYLLLFCPYFFSWANPLVAPRLNFLASSEFKSYSIPPPPSFLFPSPRASVIVDTSAPMFSFAILPLLAYSTLLAIFGFISVRITRWRRGHRPAALTLDDDDVELLPTNTSTLSPEFKAFPVPPPLPSLVPSHARSRSFSNLQHAVVVHDMPERERPKSPLHFGLSTPGSRLKSKQRSHSAGSISSPLSPKRRLHNNNRRPFISDPESDADTVVPPRHAIASTPNTPFAPQTQFGTLVDLSVPPVPAPSPLNPIFPNMAGSAHLWALHSYTRSSTVPAEELNLIDLHTPDPEQRASRNFEPVSVPLLQESKGSNAKEQGNTSSDLDGYEPDVEGEAGEQITGLGKDKEIDIGLEWDFESVSGSSMRVSSIPQAHQVSEERDLVDGNSMPSSPVEFLATQLHSIPITASSSLSEGYLRLDTEEVLAGKSEDSLPLSSSSSSAILSSSSSLPSAPRHLVELDAGHRPIDVVIVENTGVEDEDELDLNLDNETLPSISRDDTSLDLDLIHRVYNDDDENAAGQLELGPGMFVARDREDDELYDLYENNDRVEGDEYAEGAKAEEVMDQGMPSGVNIMSLTQDENIDVLTYTDNSSTNPESQEAIQDSLTPPPSHEKFSTLVSRAHPDNDVGLELRMFEDGFSDEPQANEGDVNVIEDDDEHIEETEGEFPDPDLLPLPELDIPLLLANITSPDPSLIAKEEEPSSSAATTASVSPTSQIPTPPASPPQQRRPLPRPLPAWSIRAADAPPLGLASRSPVLRHKSSFSLSVIEGSDARVVKEAESQLKTEIEIREKNEEGISSLSDEIIESEDVRPSTKTPVPSAAILPGAFPVDVHPLSDLMVPDDEEEDEEEAETTTKETESSSTQDESVPGSSAEAPSTSTSTSISVTKPVKRHPARSPIDIALAMQLRPGLGLGADPAWMVRFLMAMFGWFVVLISGSAGDGYGRTPYVGIRRSEE
ncbi:uncharacterized protein C8R40DRAFT_886231 [Lentinula edodes]|uniref:uncharacterized protein n=1 Tax=Lentinula edodes TaxID=5353 RepID=UPI001E8CCD8C|nr:uncharacterized protein C8R40DRAFT_886231 [Lentinula edodes]KAH7867976.1 hypothetical protein C8R40DRAFT_886231 [Lentinula edodes]